MYFKNRLIDLSSKLLSQSPQQHVWTSECTWGCDKRLSANPGSTPHFRLPQGLCLSIHSLL